MISENPTTDELQCRIRALEREVADYKARLAEERTAVMKQQRYGLVWEDVPEAFDAQAENRLPILEEDPALSVLQDDGRPTHLLIEGDNYHALTCLNYTHRGRVDVIYIDPPYNTGSDGFTYRDRRFLSEYPNGQKIDSNHPLRHSVWLSFMSKRLLLCKELLKKDGLLFISIGDDEVNALTMYCDSILTRIGLVTRIAKKGSDQGTHFRPTKDYVLVYCKGNKTDVAAFADPYFELNRTYKLKDERGAFRKAHSLYQASLDPLRGCVNQRYYMEAPDGTLIIPPGNVFPEEKADGAKVIPATHADKVWRWSVDSYKNKKHLIYFAKSKKSPLVDSNGDPTSWNVYEKKYQDEEQSKEVDTLPNDVIYDYPNSFGTDRLNDLQIHFPYSKPVELIEYLIEITQKPKDILVLDFFAGSGTTCDAVTLLNARDKGQRQCILVQQQEDTKICETVTRERCRKVLTGYNRQDGEHVDGLGGSLRYYRTAFVGKHRAQQAGDEDAVALALKAGCLLAIAENTLSEQKRTDSYQLFADRDGRTTAIYFREGFEQWDAFLADVRQTTGHVVVYVFCWGDASDYEDDFAEFGSRVELKSIPQPILDIYKALA